MFDWDSMKNKIILADNKDVMKDIPDKFFELAIVDPPYGIGEDGGKHIEWKSRPNSVGKEAKHKKKEWDNNCPDEKYFDELFRISKNQIIWGGNYFTEFLKVSGCWIVWDKLIEIKMFTTCEIAWASFKNNQINRFRCHPFDKLKGGKNKIHPTQKPVALYRWLLQNYAKPNDKIIDTHSGSGSLACACHLEKFDFLAIEKDEDYFKSSVERLETLRSQGVLF